MRKAGYKTVLVADTWVYHPLPASLAGFVKTFFRNGLGSAYCQKHQPELVFDTDERIEMSSFQPRISFVQRLFRFPGRIIKAALQGKFFRSTAYCIYGAGFFYGIIKYSFIKAK
jgi:hypothetical protein